MLNKCTSIVVSIISVTQFCNSIICTKKQFPSLFYYYQVKNTPRAQLQLVGVTAMLIASKYEEMYAPEVRDFVFITAEAYTSAQIREKEREMLKVLDYTFGNPLCLHFLRRFSRAGDVSLIIISIKTDTLYNN